MAYVDGFVIPIAKKQVASYRRIAKAAGKVWMDHGAIQYYECVGDDMGTPMGVPFPKLTKLKKTDTVIFSWIVYRSKAHRDKVNAAVMNDKWMSKMLTMKMPFDVKRMSYAGFKTIVEL
ncbi:MAG: DUF1428 domain-containing protein [Bdellovibrionota bacterium]